MRAEVLNEIKKTWEALFNKESSGDLEGFFHKYGKYIKQTDNVMFGGAGDGGDDKGSETPSFATTGLRDIKIASSAKISRKKLTLSGVSRSFAMNRPHFLRSLEGVHLARVGRLAEHQLTLNVEGQLYWNWGELPRGLRADCQGK